MKCVTISISICHEVKGQDSMILVFWMLNFKPIFSTLIKRLFSTSFLSAIRVVSSAYLRLLIFLPAILIPACASSSPQSFPASGSFQMSQFFTSGGQSIRVSASVPPMNTQDWSPLGWTGWISLQSMGLSRVFPNTTVQKHQFFSAQLSSQSNFHIHTITTTQMLQYEIF